MSFERGMGEMDWETMGWLVDSYEKGKTSFLLHILGLVAIVIFVISVMVKNGWLQILSIGAFFIVIALFFVLPKSNTEKIQKNQNVLENDKR
jgi:c-di-AMP phosphodiesterase-like protein